MENSEVVIIKIGDPNAPSKPPIPIRTRRSELQQQQPSAFVAYNSSSSRPSSASSATAVHITGSGSRAPSIDRERSTVTVATVRSVGAGGVGGVLGRPPPATLRRYSVCGGLTPHSRTTGLQSSTVTSSSTVIRRMMSSSSRDESSSIIHNGLHAPPPSAEVITTRSYHDNAFEPISDKGLDQDSVSTLQSQHLENEDKRLSTALDISYMTRRLNRLERELSSDRKLYDRPTATTSETNGFGTYTQPGHARRFVSQSTVNVVTSYQPRPRVIDDGDDVTTMTSLADLRWRAEEAKHMLDKQKSLLDRYTRATPISTSLASQPIAEHEVTTKYTEVIRRLPSTADNGLSSTPPVPVPVRNTAHLSAYGRRTSLPVFNRTDLVTTPQSLKQTTTCRPPVSDLRKRVRKVICNVRNDEGYFDY